MGYEIPQNLKYEEKIIFGLTFKQMLWLGIFSGIGAIIFLKSDFAFEIKTAIAIVFGFLGIGFSFFNFSRYLADYNTYRKSIRQAGFFDDKMMKFIEVQKIGNDVIYMKDNSMRGIIKVKPINFRMLSIAEQQAVISAYKDFLNSLDFPIQIVARTVNLSLDDYMDSLGENVRKANSEELLSQFGSFRDFINSFIDSNCVKDRLFYIIVPYSPQGRVNIIGDFILSMRNFLFMEKNKTSYEMNKELALNQIDVRIRLCMEKLKRCNLMSERLGTEKLVSLFASYFNNFVEAKGDYLFFITLLQKFSAEKGVQKYADAEGNYIYVGGETDAEKAQDKTA